MSSTFLDDHLIVNIVSWLPVESVLRCRCVCKTWRTLLHELYFTQIHTDRTTTLLLLKQQQQQRRRHSVSFFILANIPNTNDHEFCIQDYYYNDDDDEGKWKWKWKRIKNSNSCYDEWLVVIGSINGLICFYLKKKSFIGSSFSIYNPITKEYLNLPSLDSDDNDDDDGCMAIGFGYHPSTNQYKIVRIVHLVTNVRWVQIYTLGSSGKWRDRKEMGQTRFSGAGVYSYVNRAIYWLDTLGKIVSFDLEDEKFRMIPTPTRGIIGNEIGELAGEEGLCAIEPSNVSTNIYIMNNTNGKYLWSKKFSIPVMAASYANIQYKYKPIAVTRKGRVLCLCNKRFLISFDPITKTINRLGYVTCFEGWTPIVSYTKSFVSLKSLGEEDAKIVDPGAAAKKKKMRTRNIDMKTEMIKLFTSLLQNWFVD